MEHRIDHFDSGEAIEIAKRICGISKENAEMTDNEISTAIKWIAQKAPDTVWVDGSPVFGRMGTGIMLSLALIEFPEFYDRHNLSQFN